MWSVCRTFFFFLVSKKPNQCPINFCVTVWIVFLELACTYIRLGVKNKRTNVKSHFGEWTKKKHFLAATKSTKNLMFFSILNLTLSSGKCLKVATAWEIERVGFEPITYLIKGIYFCKFSLLFFGTIWLSQE